MSRALAGGRFDVVLFPTRYTFVPLPGRTPAVLTMHDATDATQPQLLFPSWRAHLFWRIKSALAIRRATRIMTVSHDARRQIAREFGLPEASLGVVSEGPDPVFRPLHDASALAAISRARCCACTAPHWAWRWERWARWGWWPPPTGWCCAAPPRRVSTPGCWRRSSRGIR